MTIAGIATKVGHVLLLPAIVTIMLPMGCRNSGVNPVIKHAQLQIKREGGMSWKCQIGSDNDLNIEGYVFRASRGTGLAFEKMSQLSEESVLRAKRLQASAPTAELRESYAREVKEYEEGLHMGVGRLPGWEMIFIFPISMDMKMGTKVFWVGRLEKARMDIAFTISSSEKVPWSDIKAVCRIVAAEIVTRGSDGIDKPTRPGYLFDEHGSLVADEFREFAKDMGFPRQH